MLDRAGRAPLLLREQRGLARERVERVVPHRLPHEHGGHDSVTPTAASTATAIATNARARSELIS